MTTDDAATAMIDLAYGLAMDHGGTTTEGIYVDQQPTGARMVVDDEINSAVYYLDSVECTRLGRYLLACAQAVKS